MLFYKITCDTQTIETYTIVASADGLILKYAQFIMYNMRIHL